MANKYADLIINRFIFPFSPRTFHQFQLGCQFDDDVPMSLPEVFDGILKDSEDFQNLKDKEELTFWRAEINSS